MPLVTGGGAASLPQQKSPKAALNRRDEGGPYRLRRQVWSSRRSLSLAGNVMMGMRLPRSLLGNTLACPPFTAKVSNVDR